MPITVATEGSESVAAECVSDHPCADIILRSSDSREFRVPRIYIIDSSPVLATQIQVPSPDISNPSTSSAAIRSDTARASLPVYHLPERGDVLSSLLSYVIISMTPSLPPTIEKIFELLSVAQKYEMVLVLAHIRDHISRQNPPLIRKSTAFHAYSLAQKYGLRQEALLGAQLTLNLPLTIESLESTAKLDIMPSPFLYELWRYHARVQQFLEDDLVAFITSGTAARINVRCRELDNWDVPVWLGDYIDSIARSPALFDLSEFHMTLTRHIMPSDPRVSDYCQSCASIESKTIDTFWTALKGVVQSSMEDVSVVVPSMLRYRSLILLQAGADFVLGGERQRRSSTKSKVSPPECLHTSGADIILRSSDLVDFRVHKSTLSISSPFFSDMFSLPQPPLGLDEVVDNLPVVQLSECAEVLLGLITILYPIPTVIPDSYDKALDLLAASQKYDMPTVQSTIRSEMKSRNLTTPTGALAFRAYAIASNHGLIPEMEAAARLTLEYPMSFEFIGEHLAAFGGFALRDLVRYRKRCRDSLTSCLESLLDSRLPPSDIWVGCPNTTQSHLAGWLLSLHLKSLKVAFTRPLPRPSSFSTEYLAALQGHINRYDCSFCSKVHIMHGETYREQVETKLAKALDDVRFNPESTQDAIEQPGSD
ncbi:hypothetical protein EDB86DRAFT_2833061 [Lactarius hatsudake]|nr:hypothetical protein EDB86DRAFT_2833061 [Lactarius hatsudake]